MHARVDAVKLRHRLLQNSCWDTCPNKFLPLLISIWASAADEAASIEVIYPLLESGKQPASACLACVSVLNLCVFRPCFSWSDGWRLKIGFNVVVGGFFSVKRVAESIPLDMWIKQSDTTAFCEAT